MHSISLSSVYWEKQISGLTHRFFPYTARAPPEIPRELIRSLTDRRSIVIDPFCGGGTVVVEAMAAGRGAIGNDLNPLATYVTRVKTQLVPLPRLFTSINSIAKELKTSSLENIRCKTSLFEKREKEAIHPKVRSEIIAIKGTIDNSNFNVRIKRILLLALASSCVSIQYKRKAIEINLRDLFLRRLGEMYTGMNELHRIVDHRKVPLVLNEDATQLHSLMPNTFPRADLMFTSPPYKDLHVEYSELQLNGRIRSMLLFKILGLGFSRKNYLFPRDYFGNLERFAEELPYLLNKKGYASFLIGFKSHEEEKIFTKLITKRGFRLLGKWPRAIQRTYNSRRKWHNFLLEKDIKLRREVLYLFRYQT